MFPQATGEPIGKVSLSGRHRRSTIARDPVPTLKSSWNCTCLIASSSRWAGAMIGCPPRYDEKHMCEVLLHQEAQSQCTFTPLSGCKPCQSTTLCG